MYRDAKGFISGEVQRRSTAAGQQVNASAAHLRSIADQLRGDDLGRPAAVYVDRGAGALEQVGQYLEQTDGDQLLADADSFGRERPWAVAAAGFLAGLAASRMVKAAAAGRANGYSRSDVTPAASYAGTGSASSPGATGKTGTMGAGAATVTAPGKAGSPSVPSGASAPRGPSATGASPSPTGSSAAGGSTYSSPPGTGRTPVSSDAAPSKARTNTGPAPR